MQRFQSIKRGVPMIKDPFTWQKLWFKKSVDVVRRPIMNPKHCCKTNSFDIKQVSQSGFVSHLFVCLHMAEWAPCCFSQMVCSSSLYSLSSVCPSSGSKSKKSFFEFRPLIDLGPWPYFNFCVDSFMYVCEILESPVANIQGCPYLFKLSPCCDIILWDR